MPSSAAVKIPAPSRVGIKHIPTTALVPNPHNPRLLFDKLPLDTLKGSIAKVGILVPLTVYWSSSRKLWVILDGQRRWICAKDLGIPEVPANQVAEPTTVENIVTMFQIHKLREDWELMPTALKLEVLMKELRERGDNRLAELTGLDRAVVVRCKKLLTFDRKYQDMMLAPVPEARVKADFFIELHAVLSDRIVRRMPWFKPGVFIDRMLRRYLARNGIKAVTDFRAMKQYIANAARVGKVTTITRRLQEFTMDDSRPLSHLALPDAAVGAAARKLTKRIVDLRETIAELDAAEYYGEEQLWAELKMLVQLIFRKFKDAGRRQPVELLRRT